MKKHALYQTFLISLIFVSTIVSAAELTSRIGLGERTKGDFFGPISPEIKHWKNTNKLTFEDNDFLNQYWLRQDPSLNELKNLLSDQLIYVNQCSNDFLFKNIDYIRYVYRLLSLNYLYEMINHYHLTAYKFHMDDMLCRPDWEKIIDQCRPEGTDMKLYLKRVRELISKPLDKKLYEHLTREQRAKRLASFNRNLEYGIDPEDISYERVRIECEESGECNSLSLKTFEKYLGNACQEDLQIFKQVCSEKDQFYGMGFVPYFQIILEQSNISSLVEKSNTQCLGRYSEMFYRQEYIPEHLVSMFDYVYENLQNSKNAKYVTGRIFIPGALKEFDVKGVTDFLFKPKKKTKIVKKEEPKIVKQEPKIVEKKVEVKPVRIVRKKVAPPPEKIKESKKESAFEAAVFKLNKYGLSLYRVNMRTFKQDYQFSESIAKALQKSLDRFQTRQAITQMKKFDHLGQKKAPVSLRFIKFMMDFDKHQALFNLTSIIGNEFYVINDWETARSPQLVRLENNKETNWKWEIAVLAEKVEESED